MGPARAIVAFSAICAHKLAYPTRDVSFIRYQPQRSATSDAQVIHCCADHSVYDPAGGARVLVGSGAAAARGHPARLRRRDRRARRASARVGAEQFDAFFGKYEFRLALEHGQGKARRPVGATTVVQGAHAVLQADDPVLSQPADAAIVVADLAKSYGAVEAVKGISFAVRRGTTTALLGGNGAGKTTTLSMLLGVLTPTAGRITVLGEEMPAHRHRVLPRMNFTSPYVDLPKRLTVGENLASSPISTACAHPRERIAAVAADCDLGDRC